MYYGITENMQGMTIEEFLRRLGYSRHLLVHLRRTPDGLTIHGEKVYTTHKLIDGEVLRVSIREEDASEGILPVPMDLDILYEDEDILVVNKAAGTPIHPSQGNYGNTLV